MAMDEREAIVARMRDARASLDAGDARRVFERETQALWYAWGQLDSGALSSRDLDHGWTFASMQAAEYVEWLTEQRSSMASILDGWRAYMAAHGITRA